MLALHGNALLQTTRDHRLIKDKVREVGPLPQLDLEELLKRYAADAPALYWLPGTLRVQDDAAVMTFTLAGVVRNVGGHEKAFAGDGLDLGADHLLQMAVRAIHGKQIGSATWNLVRAEMEDDPIFDATGIAAISMTFESTPVALDADWDLDELADFKTFHADVDLKPMAGEAEYQSWLQEPPSYAQSRPDLQLDATLQGAS